MRAFCVSFLTSVLLASQIAFASDDAGSAAREAFVAVIQEAIAKAEGVSPMKYRSVLRGIARRLRDAANSKTSELEKLRQEANETIVTEELGGLPDDIQTEFLKIYRDVRAKLKVDTLKDVAAARVVYREIAGILEKAGKAPAEGSDKIHDDEVSDKKISDIGDLDLISDDLKKTLVSAVKTSTSDQIKFRENVAAFTKAAKEILEKSYADDEVEQLRSDTKEAVLKVINKGVVGNIARDRWTTAYNEFVEWADSSGKFDSKTVAGWKLAVTFLVGSVNKVEEIYVPWLEDAKKRFAAKKPSSTSQRAAASGTGTGAAQPWSCFGWRKRYWDYWLKQQQSP